MVLDAARNVPDNSSDRKEKKWRIRVIVVVITGGTTKSAGCNAPFFLSHSAFVAVIAPVLAPCLLQGHPGLYAPCVEVHEKKAGNFIEVELALV